MIQLATLRSLSGGATALASLGATWTLATFMFLVAIGGIAPESDVPATWLEYALGASLLVMSVICAPTFCAGAVVLWNNAPFPGRWRVLSLLSLGWVSFTWLLTSLATIVTILFSEGYIAVLILAPFAVTFAVLSAVTGWTTFSLASGRSSGNPA